MKDIAIYGAGGLGREVACMIDRINKANGPSWNLIGFFDDGKNIGDDVSHFGKILGGINELNNWKEPISISLCFGNPNTLKVIHSNISNPLLCFPNLIAPDFRVSDPEYFEIGIGNIIKGQCDFSTNIKVGNFNVFNGMINLGHDVKIGNYNIFMPGCQISGEVEIGEVNLLGSHCFVKQQIKIGRNVTLSPLSPLLTKPKDNNTYIGNPAKIFKF